MSADPVQAGEAFATLAPHLIGTLHQATISGAGLRVEVTDAATLQRLIKTYGLARTHSFTGCYVGTVGGVPVTVSVSRVIPARLRQAGEVA